MNLVLRALHSRIDLEFISNALESKSRKRRLNFFSANVEVMADPTPHYFSNEVVSLHLGRKHSGTCPTAPCDSFFFLFKPICLPSRSEGLDGSTLAPPPPT